MIDGSRRFGKQTRVLLVGLVVLLALVAVLYSPKYNSFFTRDDFVWLDYSSRGIPDVSSTSVSGFFMPVPKLFFLAATNIFKSNPIPYNVLNVLFHIVNVLLLAWFIYSLTSSNWAALGGSAMLALSYPAYEAVSWVSCVVWQLTVLLVLAASLSYTCFRKLSLPGGPRIKDIRKSGRKGVILYSLSIVFLILALLTKEAAITLPILILALELFVFSDISGPGHLEKIKAGVVYLIPFFAITLVYGVASLPSSPETPSSRPANGRSAPTYSQMSSNSWTGFFSYRPGRRVSLPFCHRGGGIRFSSFSSLRDSF